MIDYGAAPRARVQLAPIVIVRSNNVDAGRVAVLRSLADAVEQGFDDVDIIPRVFFQQAAREVIIVRCFGGETIDDALDDAMRSHPRFDPWHDLREDHHVFLGHR